VVKIFVYIERSISVLAVIW